MERIIKKAVETHKIFEINSQPDRLDMDADHCQLAKELGAKFAINTDAHSVSELNFENFGIAQARRGWLEKENVINTLEWTHLKKLLKMSR